MVDAEAVKTVLMKVVANMEPSKSMVYIPLKDLVIHKILEFQKDMKPIFALCEEAAREAHSEAISMPQAISVQFDFAPAKYGGGGFTFRRLRSQS